MASVRKCTLTAVQYENCNNFILTLCYLHTNLTNAMFIIENAMHSVCIGVIVGRINT